MSLDESKDLVTVKGMIDVKEMVSYLNSNEAIFTFSFKKHSYV